MKKLLFSFALALTKIPALIGIGLALPHFILIEIEERAKKDREFKSVLNHLSKTKWNLWIIPDNKKMIVEAGLINSDIPGYDLIVSHDGRHPCSKCCLKLCRYRPGEESKNYTGPIINGKEPKCLSFYGAYYQEQK